MTKTLLIYSPFCTPVTPPYSVTNLYSFLDRNLPKGNAVDVIDLNVLFHELKLEEYKDYFSSFDKDFVPEDYEETATRFRHESSKLYSKNNQLVIKGKKPDEFSVLLDRILTERPDICAFSLVYSSQCFYTAALIKELKKKGIKIIIGGPAVSERLRGLADYTLKDELELLDCITGRKNRSSELVFDYHIDYSIYEPKRYFSPEPVLSLKSSSTCYYQRCAFCTHHSGGKYHEYPLEDIKKTIISSGARYFFFIDDMIHKKRLLDIAAMMKPLGVRWMCQLKPSSELDQEILDELYSSGLRVILWGVESGCDRILRLMQKGTKKKDISRVLGDSHSAGIRNVAYMIFGFPTETEDELLETIDFLKENKDDLDLVSVSMFGLQQGSLVYRFPERFGVKNVEETERTMLDPSLDFEVVSGLSRKKAFAMRKKYSFELDKIDRYPKSMNFFREHFLLLG